MRQQQQKQHKKTRPQQDHQQSQQQRCGSRAALCCSCRLSVSSSEEAESASSSSSSSSSSEHRYASVSSLAHAMVQERLDQMIKEMQLQNDHQIRSNYSTRASANAVAERSTSRRQRSSGTIHDQGTTKFVLMVAMETCSEDPREDFRESMVEMIRANRIDETRDLRSLLDCYVSMNSEEYHGVILEVFHEVCSHLFLYSCKAQYH